jgi:hypothetical protein
LTYASNKENWPEKDPIYRTARAAVHHANLQAKLHLLLATYVSPLSLNCTLQQQNANQTQHLTLKQSSNWKQMNFTLNKLPLWLTHLHISMCTHIHVLVLTCFKLNHEKLNVYLTYNWVLSKHLFTSSECRQLVRAMDYP